MATKKRPRLGRPPASSSAETRQRILDVARESFAELGYGVTTNKYVATKAGITTGALYHYFDSKHDIYVAVFQQVEERVRERFEEVMAQNTTFRGQLGAVLAVSHEMNAEDNSIARFLGAARTDMVRHDDLHRALRARPSETRTIINQMIETGIATGEIDPSQRDQVLSVLRVVFTGLVDAVSHDLGAQLDAINGVLALIDGKLVRKPQRKAR